MSVPGYESYRDSQVEWLGDVPAHWKIMRFSRVVFIAEGQVDPRFEPYASMALIAPNHVESGTGRLLNIETAAEQGADSGKYRFAEGEVIYSKIRPALAKVVLAPCSGLCSADMYPLKGVNGLVSAYLKWVLLCPQFTAWTTLESDRVAMPKINREKLNEFRLTVPSAGEQNAIAAFLDRETGKIDALAEAQRRLIELLKEKRQAVISHAVTKGLDPAVPMKDSGVEWLGQVPAHWEVKPLKRVGDFNAGAGFPDAEQGLETEEIPFHKVNALALADPEGCLKRGENSVSSATAKRLGAYVFPARSIVFAKIGAALLLGRLRLLREPACLDNNMMGLTVRDDQDVDFVRSAMSLVKFDLISNPGTVPSLNKGQISNAEIPVPPLAEQEAISDWLGAAGLRFDRLADEASAAITLLKERRSALISAAVTGKIDVRGLVLELAEAA